METTTTYFEQRGKANQRVCWSLARGRAQALGIDQIIIPTTAGTTGMRAVEQLAGLQVVVVTHSTGFTEPGRQESAPGDRGRAAGQGRR